MNVVLDANILISCAASTRGTLREIMDRLEAGQFNLLTSLAMLKTLDRTLHKPFWLNHAQSIQILFAVDLFAELATVVAPATGIHGVAEDDEDDLVLATAVAAEADFLVTGDRYLLGIGAFRGVRIVTAREFLDVLLGDQPDNADAG